MAASLLPPTAFVTDLVGGIIILPAVDAHGWSSAVLERGLALRRRRGPASCPRRGCGWVVCAVNPAAAATGAAKHGCPREEGATPGPGALVGVSLLGIFRSQSSDISPEMCDSNVRCVSGTELTVVKKRKKRKEVVAN
ncbi:hypothetical protein EJB05_02936, partial [Eragrostis curvula]